MKILVFDFETTGLTLHRKAQLAKQPRSIEFGGVLLDGAEVAQELSLLINPQQSLAPIITKITGLSDEDLAEQPTFAEVLPQLRAIFAAADGMVAHNLPFDRAIMTHELERLGVEDFPWPPIAICTAQLHQEGWGRRPKLLQLYEDVLGRPLAQTHRALDDCHALAEIVLALNIGEHYEALLQKTI